MPPHHIINPQIGIQNQKRQYLVHQSVQWVGAMWHKNIQNLMRHDTPSLVIWKCLHYPLTPMGEDGPWRQREKTTMSRRRKEIRLCVCTLRPSARDVVVALLLEEGRPPARNSGDTVCIIDLHTSDTHRILPLFIVTFEPVDIPGWEAPPTRRNIRACSKVSTRTGRVDRGELCYERKLRAVGSN